LDNIHVIVSVSPAEGPRATICPGQKQLAAHHAQTVPVEDTEAKTFPGFIPSKPNRSPRKAHDGDLPCTRDT